MNGKNQDTLEIKLERLKSGLPANDLYAMKEVEKSANLKLKDYFGDMPEELETIKTLFPEKKNIEELTYMEMAVIVNRKILNGKWEFGKQMLLILAKPLDYEVKRRQLKDGNASVYI